MLRVVIAFGLTGCFSYGLCQSEATPAVYEAFFRRVAQLQLQFASGQGLLNGGSSTVRQPRAQEVLGLTDREAQILNALASDLETTLTAIDEARRPVTFEARLRAMESEGGKSQVSEEQLLEDLDRQRHRAVAAHTEQLRAAFGGERFQVVEAYMRSRTSGTFFPTVPEVHIVRK